MSLDERHELEQLDALAVELTRAGRTARGPTGRGDVPDPAFATRLRVQLVGEPSPVGAVRPVPAPPVGRAAAARPGPKVPSPRPETPAQPVAAPVPARPSAAANRRPRPMPEPPPFREVPKPEASQQAAVRPIVRWKMPSLVFPTRWVATALAACVAIGALFYGSTLLFPPAPFAVANVAQAANVVHAGAQKALKAGDELHEGDEIMVGIGGAATLKMGGSFVRLAPGSDIRLRQLRSDGIVLDLLAGEAYNRVAVGGSYAVVTGPVTWTARGTAFDIDRHATESGDEEVLGLALLHDLELTSMSFDLAVSQGQCATIALSGGILQSSPDFASISQDVLTGPWLTENAHLDQLAGLDLGELAADVSATPWPSGVEPAPSGTGPATAVASGPSTARTSGSTRTPRPAIRPTPKPTPRPTPFTPANLGSLTAVDNGDGTYTFSWPRYTGLGFTKYVLEAIQWGSSPSYPTSTQWGSSTSVDQTTWTGVLNAGDWAVRLQVIDASRGLIRAQTNVIRVTVGLPPTVNLGTLDVTDNGDGTYTFSWTGYTDQPFDYYKLVFEPWPNSPSYTSGSPYWDGVSSSATADTLTVGVSNGGDPFMPGDYAVRIQAVGYPLGAAYVFAQTSVAHVTVQAAPAPTPT